ncbi:MAG: hypothetical protein LH606_05635 [Cytophagaceae bacterium]|nr:hypothetical protein [Cytophagaceae bacterium]
MKKLRDFLNHFGLRSLQIDLQILEMTFDFTDSDRLAAWDLYVELITRIVTQPLPDADGDEQAALNSVHSLFGTTREILKKHGPNAYNFARIAVVILNQKIRPFTTKWHRLALAGAFQSSDQCRVFRRELNDLQTQVLHHYCGLLAEGIIGLETDWLTPHPSAS